MMPVGGSTHPRFAAVRRAFEAAALMRLVDRNMLDLDDPVTGHWPEFAANGKEKTTVRHVLAHASGLPAFPRPIDDIADWHAICGMLAAAEPEFPAGTAVAEHAMTYGHLVGELIRRVDGRLPGQVDETGQFGMGGIGGCDAYANPKRGYAYAYVTRCLGDSNSGSVAETGDFDRSERLIEALEGCL
jgi:CubicO group peptidase (beta-lactamase class C family)